MEPRSTWRSVLVRLRCRLAVRHSTLPLNHVAVLSVSTLATSHTSTKSSAPREAGAPRITHVEKQSLRLGEPGSWGSAVLWCPVWHLLTRALSHTLGRVPGPQMADATRSEAFLILEVSGRSSTPGTELGCGALVGWAACEGCPAWPPL